MTDTLQVVKYSLPATENLLSQAYESLFSVQETYTLTKLTLNVPTNCPYTTSDSDFHLMVVGFVQITDRLQMVINRPGVAGAVFRNTSVAH